MKRCEKCGGLLLSKLEDIPQDDYVCDCTTVSGVMMSHAEYRRKQANKKDAKHWKNGREQLNGRNYE